MHARTAQKKGSRECNRGAEKPCLLDLDLVAANLLQKHSGSSVRKGWFYGGFYTLGGCPWTGSFPHPGDRTPARKPTPFNGAFGRQKGIGKRPNLTARLFAGANGGPTHRTGSNGVLKKILVHFSRACAWILLLGMPLYATSQSSVSSEPDSTNFTVRVELKRLDKPGHPSFKVSTIHGILFPDGFHIINAEKQPVTGKAIEQCARLNDTLYSLQHHRENRDAYQALLEGTLAPRFLSSPLQYTALALMNTQDLKALMIGDKRIILTLGVPFPEYYNTYFVDLSQFPRAWRLIVKAPNIAVGDKGTVVLPPPYEHGFTYWTLDVELKNRKPSRAIFTRFLPTDDAVKSVREGRKPRVIEIEDSSAELSFSWGSLPFGLGRLPSPPKVPFKVVDHRRIFDINTNNRISLTVEGAPVLYCANDQWTISDATAERAAFYVARGIKETSLAAPLWRKVIIAGLMFVSAFVLGAIFWIMSTNSAPKHKSTLERR